MPKPVVAIQGERGSFSEEAARKLLGPSLSLLCCGTFASTFASVAKRRAGACLVPIENTLAGSVHEVYDLLLEGNLQIVAEVNLRVAHCLITFPETTLSRLRRVYSHPVALAQCRGFFRRHPKIETIPFYDTAGSVKMLAEKRIPGAAAIASRAAAGVYGARILRAHLEDHRENYTRFLLLQKSPGAGPPKPASILAGRRRANKTSIVFSTAHVPGSLFKCLSVFALREINLTKLESRPLRGRPWEYLFYLDFAGDLREERCRKALEHLREVTDSWRVLGCYPSAESRH